LFSNALRHSEEQLRHARDRRERGNPPGKQNNPLGDQLSWEQWLDAVKNQRRVWVITRDSDYIERIGGTETVLNPFLAAELKVRGVDDIRAFDNLAKAITDIKAAGVPVSRAPSDQRLTELTKALEPTYFEPDYGNRPWLHPMGPRMMSPALWQFIQNKLPPDASSEEPTNQE
jgi:hypothetical protein